MTPSPSAALVSNELDLLESLVDVHEARIVELGCGAAQLARDLLGRHPHARVTGIDPDERQLAKNRTKPQERLEFLPGGAGAIPFEAASFDGALMLKSLHHVPADAMDGALEEVARVLKPGAWLYVSEPVFAGEFNELVRLFNDEQAVRAQAQRALDRALASGRWTQQAEQRFETPVDFASVADFESRMLNPTFAERHVDAAKLHEIRRVYARYAGGDGPVHFTRPMHVRVLRRAR
ncbi:MAG TPA: class I SAM-dependent methyltransferase [Ramlibacter sp.]